MTDETTPDILEELRWQKRYANGRVPYTMERAAKEIERLQKLELAAKLLLGQWERYRGSLPEPMVDELVRLREAVDADTAERLNQQNGNKT